MMAYRYENSCKPGPLSRIPPEVDLPLLDGLVTRLSESSSKDKIRRVHPLNSYFTFRGNWLLVYVVSLHL
jgi:hypothetical protein